ncbi:MAG: undecaprenyl-diphosphate phosphatase [Patescibacteria group bacterium]
MTALQSLILGIVQGVTEFFPISSSGHLVLIPYIFNWEGQPLAFDAILHLGTGLAVLFYFRREWWGMISSFIADLREADFSRTAFYASFSQTSRQLVFLVLASLPAILAGLLLNDWVESTFRLPWVVAVALFVVGGLMLFTQKVQPTERLNLQTALLIGFSQVLALVPGVSRSGITITTALFLGLRKDIAAQFSFLLSLPIVLGAGIWGLFSLSSLITSYQLLVTGFVASLFSGLLAIHFFLKLLSYWGLIPFAVYRILLAILFLLITY